MQTWAVSAQPQQRASSRFGINLCEALAGATDAIGEPDFAMRALRLVNAALVVDFLSVYRVYRDQPPRMFFSGSLTDRDVSEDCFRRYQRGLYRRDKTFVEAKELAAGGTPTMTLWNEAEIPSPHRDQIYRRHGIHERLSVVAAGESDSMLAINLYRYDVTGAFLAKEVDAAQGIADDLALSVASVKTYRARAFDRLGIHFRNELFALIVMDASRRGGRL